MEPINKKEEIADDISEPTPWNDSVALSEELFRSRGSNVTSNIAKDTKVEEADVVEAGGVGADSIKDTMIDWGTGAGQVSTADMPEQTNLYYTEARVSANSSVAANTAKTGVTTQISNVVEDTTPQLGGTLDAQSNKIDNLDRIDTTNSTFTGYNSDGGEMIQFFNDGGTAPAYPQFYGESGGAQLSMYALGDDTNIDISLVPKGSGRIIYGNYDAPMILSRDVTATTLNTSTTETTVFTFSVPANIMQTNRTLRWSCIMEAFNNSGGDVVFTVRSKFGTTTLIDFDRTQPTNASRRGMNFTGEITNLNATGTQVAKGWFYMGAAGTVDGATAASNVERFAINNSITEDTTGALTFSITVQMDTSNALAEIVAHSSYLELV